MVPLKMQQLFRRNQVFEMVIKMGKAFINRPLFQERS